MSKQNVNFKVNTNIDLDDLFVRRALFTRGGLWIWGSNLYYQLGDNYANFAVSSPIQTVAGGSNWKQVSVGGYHAAGIKTDGTLWLWGYNYDYELGTGDYDDRLSPVQTISGGNNWKQVDCAWAGTAAIKTDGTLWLWGYNSNGAIGDNTRTDRASPVQTVSGGTNWKEVSNRNSLHVAAIKTDGTLWIWGLNGSGQLGDNTVNSKSSPIQTVSGGNNWKSVCVGNTFTAAIKIDGTLWSWGQNSSGQLGDNTDIDKSSPVQTVAGGTNWKQVSCGGQFNSAIKTDGTLWIWGQNDKGQLGDNTITNKSSPIQTVAGGTNWRKISAGYLHMGAIKTDGTLWVWGRNYKGGLGDNTTVDKSSPVQTVSGGTNWKEVAAGYDDSNTAGIRENYS